MSNESNHNSSSNQHAHNFSPGDVIEVKYHFDIGNKTEIWKEAFVEEVDSKQQSLLIHFLGSSQEYSVWYSIHDCRAITKPKQTPNNEIKIETETSDIKNNKKRSFEEMTRKKLSCVVCTELPLGKVIQCVSSTAHIVCEDCKQQLKNPICPICRSAFSSVRNRLAEEMIEELSVSCPNKCGVKNILVANLPNHQRTECEKRIVKRACHNKNLGCTYEENHTFQELTLHETKECQNMPSQLSDCQIRKIADDCAMWEQKFLNAEKRWLEIIHSLFKDSIDENISRNSIIKNFDFSKKSDYTYSGNKFAALGLNFELRLNKTAIGLELLIVAEVQKKRNRPTNLAFGILSSTSGTKTSSNVVQTSPYFELQIQPRGLAFSLIVVKASNKNYKNFCDSDEIQLQLGLFQKALIL